MPSIYVGHPAPSYPNDPASLVERASHLAVLGVAWAIRPHIYDRRGGFVVADLVSRVLQDPGPVFLIRPLSEELIDAVRTRLEARVPIYTYRCQEEDDFYEQLRNATAAFRAGEPLIGRDLAVALLLIRKLDQERMWAGNDKGYMWADSIPKGRGLDEEYGDRVPLILSILKNNDILVCKTSKGKNKYALNPEIKPSIYGMLRARRLPDALHARLSRGDVRVSARSVDVLSDYDGEQQA